MSMLSTTKYRNYCLILATFFTLVLNSTAFAQTILRVDGDGGQANGDGTTWPTALKYLQDAIAFAKANPGPYELWVAATIESNPYRPDRDAANPGGSGNDQLSFKMISAVQVYGGFAGGEQLLEERNILLNETVLSGEIADPGTADNSGHVVYFDSLTGSPAVIDGFTISDGNAANANFMGYGGGIFIYVSDLSIIRNCTIKNNTGVFGGGVSIYVNSVGSIVEIRSCLFQGNDASNTGGGLRTENTDGEINIITSTFIDNSAFEGGAIDIDHSENPTIVNCSFIDNNASEGGAIHTEDSSGATLINCLLYGNTASVHGGAIDHGGNAIDEVILTNCTLADNWSPQGAFYLHGGALATVVNSILWNTSDDEFYLGSNGGGITDVTYSDIQGDWDGIGNIDEQPDFSDAANGNYRLLSFSRGIDEGNNSDVQCDEFDVDDNGEDCSAPAQDTPDLDLRTRIIDGDENFTDIVDMGAYEFESCPWDLNGDCTVGTGDLLILFAQWGTDGPADFDGSGAVGTGDLLILFANWGPCSCGEQLEPLTFEEALENACLTQNNWVEYVGVMTGPASQTVKDRYQCWMTHYLEDCNKCFCFGGSGCPALDPFN